MEQNGAQGQQRQVVQNQVQGQAGALTQGSAGQVQTQAQVQAQAGQAQVQGQVAQQMPGQVQGQQGQQGVYLGLQATMTQGVVDPSMTDTERRQRAIVSFFVQKIKDLLANSPISLNKLEKTPDYPSFRQYFLHDLRTGKITVEDEVEFLRSLPDQLATLGSRRIYDLLATTDRTKQILAIVTGHNSTNWQDTVAGDIDNLLAPPARGQVDYRTPVGFAEFRRKFLEEIGKEATPPQLDAYIKAMNEVEEGLYGERYDYYREFENLRKEAMALDRGADATSLAKATAPTVDGVAADTDEMELSLQTVDSNLPTSRLTIVSEEHREQLLSHTIIEGDAWRQGGKDYRLSVANLVSAGLTPKYETNVDGLTVYLSNLFQLTSEQMAAIAYVPTSMGIKVRGYYREKNTGVWRYLPDYIRDISGEGIDMFGNGFDVDSTILPIVLQFALNQIERQRSILDLSATNPDFLFAGTAPAYATRQDFRDAYSKGLLRGDFYREVEPVALNNHATNLIGPGRRKSAPQLISVNANVYPNFEQPIARYSVYAGLTGQTLGEGYWSNDRQTQWLFYSDYRGRSWIVNQESTSEVTSTGCRKEWYLPTDLTTPLYESTLLADNYGDPGDVRAGNYISMWNNYLSKIPLIQDYVKRLAK